jgi:hypothetical protein
MESSNLKTSSLPDKKPLNAKSRGVKKSPKLIFSILTLSILVLGGLIGLYLTKINQDLRQQATDESYQTGDDYECDTNDVNACGGNPDQCHCTGGDACTGTECDDDIERNCTGQGRSYCDNWQGFGTTCCVAGYKCCDNSNGCCPGDGGPTNPPGDPTPTPRDNPTPTPTPPITITVTPTNTPTPTPPLGCGETPCETSADCGIGVGLSCVTADDGEGYCAIPQYSQACAENPSVETCCEEPTTTITPTPTTPVGPQCRNIRMYNITGGESSIMSEDDDADLVPGESAVRLVCGSSEGASLPEDYFYAFRIYEPCESDNHLVPLEFVNGSGENGINYDISMSGDFMAQCAVCTEDSEGDIVCDWESLVPTACE